MTIHRDIRTLTEEERNRYIAGAEMHERWTPAMRRKYLVAPDIVDKRPYHIKHFYLRSRVEAAERFVRERWERRRARNEQVEREYEARRQKQAAKRRQRYAERYLTWTDALPDAC